MTHDERVYHHLYVESKSPLENAERIASLEELVEELQADNAKLRTEFDKMDKWHSAELQAALAENAKLREERREYQATIDSLVDECADYKAKNAKLRELVRDYEHCSMHADCERCEYDGTTSTHCPLSPCFPDIDELNEMGVEVNE